MQVVEWVADDCTERDCSGGSNGDGGGDDGDNNSLYHPQQPRPYAGRVKVRFEDGSGTVGAATQHLADPCFMYMALPARGALSFA